MLPAVLSLSHSYQGQGDVPTFYTYEEGLSHLTAEGQATLQRLEGMLAQSVTQQFHMAGVRTDEPSAEFEGLWCPQFVFELQVGLILKIH